MKKIVGLLLLVGALGLFSYARVRSGVADERVRFYRQLAANAREREDQIASLRNGIATGAVTVGEDRAKLAELEGDETALGSAAVNEEAANNADHNRWIVMVAYLGSVLSGLIGIGYLVK